MEPDVIIHMREQFKALRSHIKSSIPEGKRRTFALIDLDLSEMMAAKAFYEDDEE